MKTAWWSQVACLCLLTSASQAAKWHVDIDVSSLSGKDVSLEFQLFDNSDVIDSLAKVDNVSLGGTLHDFESATALDSWYSFVPPTLDPSVTRESGAINGSGGFLTQIAEDGITVPVLAATDFLAVTGPNLSFDLDLSLSSTVGPTFGVDEFVVFIYDLTDGLGDFEPLAFDHKGFTASSGTTVTPIPLPSALLLSLLGLGSLRSLGRYARRNVMC